MRRRIQVCVTFHALRSGPVPLKKAIPAIAFSCKLVSFIGE
jgi:hypothetical protein